ncbi:CC/Se motif family (seleno)protein [Alkalilimnicola ehrlichii MLHE-1]|uniref:HesB/YadR/YfhF-family protein n=1 Tax=Alkalilimnicola ehrlichii (strain ATCC BAA-1101 / DSM 17681 / MLHE-1) TaxID=187272 RepID=Q0A539_ALKEH|nr:CC/Se motif family (seleno)protein [Alkalilimnicola ehrlichii]ABI58048.1 hypothetical protein Mlg_2708 [Alkalilimnicola ehrlichii MLHE-1]
MTPVILTPAARAWVLAQGGVLTVRAAPQHGCCGGHAAVPRAEVRVPEAREDYQALSLEGVTVYLARALSEGPYRVDVEGFWRWKRLVVEGAVSPWRPAGHTKTEGQ